MKEWMQSVFGGGGLLEMGVPAGVITIILILAIRYWLSRKSD